MENTFFNTKKFQEDGKQMLSLISELYDNMDQVPVQPKVQPGFLRQQFPDKPYQDGSSFEEILKDTKEKIFPGIKQWQHPGFFGYYPSCTCHPTVLADMFASTFHSPGFNWHASPSHTELENIVVDWAAQMFGLPDCFLLKNSGGGTIALSTTDAVYTNVHAAKIRKMKELNITLEDPRILKLVAYMTEISFPGFEKCIMLKDIAHIRKIPIYFDHEQQNFQPDLASFEKMLDDDIKKGLIPFWLCATLGSTPTCAHDPINKLSLISQKYKIWLNVDAAYAGSAWVCEKFRKNTDGLENADSLLINCAKFFMVCNIGCLSYVKNKKEFQKSFQLGNEVQIVKSVYSSDDNVTDYKDWMVGFGRRWNSLKFFYVMRYFGVKGIQEHIQSKANLAQYFADLIRNSDQFELFTRPEITLVTFRLFNKKRFLNLQQINQLNQKLKEKLDENTLQGFITPSQVGECYFLRLVIGNHNTTKETIDQFWKYINECALIILNRDEEEYQKQRQQNTLFNLEELITFRHNMHKYPEIGFQEFKTQQNIIDFLLSKKVPQEAIKKIASTGIIIDLTGTGPVHQNKKNKAIAFRADIDALSIQEDNQDLEYRSVIPSVTHACGHDMHTTCLLGFATLFLSKRESFPANRTVRLLFQPCEEGPESGALQMITEGCLEGIDEVYGLHQWPNKSQGNLFVRPGPMMSEISYIFIDIIGKGGHGSEPQKAIDPIQISVDFHLKMRSLKEKKYQGRQYVITFPVMKGGDRFNVIPDKVRIEGTLRSMEEGLTAQMKSDIESILEELKQEFKCNFNLKWQTTDPILNNTNAEADHINRLGLQYFGPDKTGSFFLPVMASEDFAHYTKHKPGAFFFINLPNNNPFIQLHDSKFNANDQLIELASNFWLKIAEDRLINDI